MNELSKSNEIPQKVVAAEKLLFLINQRVEGIQEAAFNIIELMGGTHQISVKQIAYLIAPYILKKQNENEETN